VRVIWPLLLVACDDHLYPPIGAGGDVAYTPDWDGAQNFMGDHCEGCHPTLSPPAMPDGLAADIVDGTGRYVVPGDPEASEFWLVLVGRSDQTPIMPLGSQPLPADVIQPIADWITNGAPLN
jgi:hypothetical protein